MKNHSDYFYLPEQQENTESGWLAFPIVLKSQKKNLRNMLQMFLEKRNIQTRAIFSGNVTKQPFMKNHKYRVNKKIFKNADLIMNNGLLLGCHQLLGVKEIKFVCNSITQFIKKNFK